MAGISMMQKLLDNALVSQFAKSLDQNDLPEGWADNPEIVQLAEDAYSVMGTESPWFKSWFGDSKVVDEAGKPLKVYHGTNAYGLKKFKPGNSGYLGGGIYTTPDRSIAERYTDYDTVHELYEKLENPFVIRSTDASSAILGELYGDKAGKELAKREAKQGNASQILTKADAKKLQQKGYDGIFWDVPSGKEYSTLDSTALKHASNRGTFNLKDSNIYKGIPWAISAGAGGLLALMGAEEAEAKPYQFPADKRGTVLYEPGLESPIVDPADLITAPFGVAGAGAKAAAMAAEPFVSYGMDKLMGGILGLFGKEE